MVVQTEPKPKRQWVSYYMLGEKGLCPACKEPGSVVHTGPEQFGTKTQVRKCRNCGDNFTSTFTVSSY